MVVEVVSDVEEGSSWEVDGGISDLTIPSFVGNTVKVDSEFTRDFLDQRELVVVAIAEGMVRHVQGP